MKNFIKKYLCNEKAEKTESIIFSNIKELQDNFQQLSIKYYQEIEPKISKTDSNLYTLKNEVHKIYLRIEALTKYLGLREIVSYDNDPFSKEMQYKIKYEVLKKLD